MRTFSPIVSAVVGGLCLLAVGRPARAADMENPCPSWKACKIGTTVRSEESNSADPTRVIVRTEKLVAADADGVTIEGTTETPADGSTPAKSETYRRTFHAGPHLAREKPASTTRPEDATVEGDEDLTLAGRTVRAHWVREKRSDTLTVTLWYSSQMPGEFCKYVSTSDDGTHREVTTQKVVKINEP